MDKLKPVIAQKFWIFFGLVLILPPVGYFMTKGQLVAAITGRWENLEKVYKEVPDGKDSPNDQWSGGLTKLNELLELQKVRAVRVLWEKQLGTQVWPADISAIMKKAPYFKAPALADQTSDVQFKYPHDYPKEIRTMWEIVDPLDDGPNVRGSDEKRKVQFEMANLHQANTVPWQDFPPTPDVIWSAQEDIWLQTELLQAVRRVNVSAKNQIEANVKQLGKILLFGGDRVQGGAAAAPGSGALPGDGGLSPSGFGGGGRSAGTGTSSDIPLAEEFIVAQDALQSGNTRGPGAFPPPGSVEGGTPAAPGAEGPNKRYIDDDPARPFKQRGFYFKAVIDHKKLPDLLTELMNSPYPVEIVRVHQVWQMSDDPFGSAPGGGGGFGAPGTSFPPIGGFGGGSLPGPSGFGGAGGGSKPGGLQLAGGDLNAGLGFGGADAGGGRGFPGGREGFLPGRFGGGEGAGGSSTTTTPGQAAMSDPNLAAVGILGMWTIYRPPMAEAAPGANPATPGADVAAPNTAEGAPNTPANTAPGNPAAPTSHSENEQPGNANP